MLAYGETPNPDKVTNILNDIYYKCTECNSTIEILSINEKENSIEFKCTNKKEKHNKKILLKEYLNIINNNKNNNKDVNEDTCDIHIKNKYESFCFDCNVHLCKECLKNREHAFHKKCNIIEIKPNSNELNIIKDITKYYSDKLEYLKIKDIKLKRKLNAILDKSRININNLMQNKIKKNEINKFEELKINKNNFISVIKQIRNKYEDEIRKQKYQFLLNEYEINKKYQLRNKKIEILYNNKLDRLNEKHKNILEKINIEKQIENINNIKRINEIVYNAYNLYNNNYYNSININNIIMNFHSIDEKIKKNIQNKTSEKDYKLMIKLSSEKSEEDIISNNNNNEIIFELKERIKKTEQKNLLLEYKLNETKENYKNEISKIKKDYYETKAINDLLKNNSSEESNKIKEYDNGRYIGGFVNGKREGKGTFFYSNGKRYEGEWKDDMEDGLGIMYYNKRKDRYEGSFKKGKKEGKGIYYYDNGNRYEGDWKDDVKDGKGIFYGDNGDRKMGDYSKGRPIGKHVILHVNGDVEIKESQ